MTTISIAGIYKSNNALLCYQIELILMKYMNNALYAIYLCQSNYKRFIKVFANLRGKEKYFFYKWFIYLNNGQRFPFNNDI